MFSDLHTAARVIAARGIAVMPCMVREKLPATSHGVKDATTDAATIDEWWRLDPQFNVAIACGEISGIFVLDIDGEDGEASLRRLEEEHGEPIPPSVEAVTGNGRHIFLRLNDDGPIPNSVSKLGPGLDTRGDGGYVVAPPSIHPSGRRYCWSVDSTSAA